MFESYYAGQKTKATADWRICKSSYDALKSSGVDELTIRATLEGILAGKPWREEILSALFMGEERARRERERQEREERNRQERERERQERQERSRRNYEEQRRSSYSNNHVSMADALAFFGFTAMPEASELKRKYRELALRLHPDKGGDTATFQRFQDFKDLLFARAGL
jgi:hypothetical protein